MLSYVKLFYSFNSETSALTDAEVGRLVRQLLAFGERGDTQHYLRGNERLLFPVYRAQLERDGEKYAALSQTRAESGRAGGKARQRMAKSGKSGHDKDKAQEEEKEKEKGKDKGAAAVSARGGGDGLRNCNSPDSESRPEAEDCDSDGDCESDCDSVCESDCESVCESVCESDCDSVCESDCESVSDSDFEDSDEWIDVTAAFRSDGCEPHRAIEQLLRRKHRNSAKSAGNGGNFEGDSVRSADDEADFDCNFADSASGAANPDCKFTDSAADGCEFADSESGDESMNSTYPYTFEHSNSEKYMNPIVQYVFENLGALSAGNLAELEAFEEVLSEAAIRFAVDRACANGVRKWSYVRKILNAWRDQGIHTLAEAQAEANRKTAPGSNSGCGNPNSGYGASNSGYGNPNSGHGGSSSGYGGSNSGYGNPNPGYGGSSSGHGGSNPALNYDQRTYTESDFADLFVDLSAPLPGEA